MTARDIASAMCKKRNTHNSVACPTTPMTRALEAPSLCPRMMKPRHLQSLTHCAFVGHMEHDVPEMGLGFRVFRALLQEPVRAEVCKCMERMFELTQKSLQFNAQLVRSGYPEVFLPVLFSCAGALAERGAMPSRLHRCYLKTAPTILALPDTERKTYIRTCVHAYIHTYIHTYIHRHALTHMQ